MWCGCVYSCTRSTYYTVTFTRYGIYLRLLGDNSETMNNIHLLLSTVKLQLKTQQYSNKSTLGMFAHQIQRNAMVKDLGLLTKF